MITPDCITSFSGQYRFLSNFYIEADGSHVEGEYQSMKTDPPCDWILNLSPGQAKKAGQRLKLRPNWELIKVEIMHSLVHEKFRISAGLRINLQLTGAAYLVEENTWGDTFWGTVNGFGSNELGKILMRVRAQLR